MGVLPDNSLHFYLFVFAFLPCSDFCCAKNLMTKNSQFSQLELAKSCCIYVLLGKILTWCFILPPSDLFCCVVFAVDFKAFYFEIEEV